MNLNHSFVSLLFVVGCVNAFYVSNTVQSTISPVKTSLFSKNSESGDDVVQQQAFTVGTFVEFEEKKREHIGKIARTEHKSNGGARYQVVDNEGKKKGTRLASSPLTCSLMTKPMP